jgi:hypothetical protein
MSDTFSLSISAGQKTKIKLLLQLYMEMIFFRRVYQKSVQFFTAEAKALHLAFDFIKHSDN